MIYGSDLTGLEARNVETRVGHLLLFFHSLCIHHLVLVLLLVLLLVDLTVFRVRPFSEDDRCPKARRRQERRPDRQTDRQIDR